MPGAIAPANQSAAGAGLCTAALLLTTHLVGSELLWRPQREPGLSPRQACLRLDPNTATRDELLLLPGIGPALADRILSYRQSAGGPEAHATGRPAFLFAEDLGRVRGIGPGRIERLGPYLRFPRPPPDAPGPDP